MFAKERLYLTADAKALVREGDRRAASLYAAVGDEIPESAVKRFGLKDGRIGKGGSKEQTPGPNKERVPGPNKEKAPDGDKHGQNGDAGGLAAGSGGATEVAAGAGGGAGGNPPAADDLTRVKFVGAKSAEALVAAGIKSFAQLAAIDPANPPQVEGMGARVNWGAIVASAAELGKAAEGDGGAGAGAGQTEG